MPCVKNTESVSGLRSGHKGRRTVLSVLVAGSLLAVSACDNINTDLERAVVGGAIGCAAGEVLLDGRCVEGAIVGAGVGVLTN